MPIMKLTHYGYMCFDAVGYSVKSDYKVGYYINLLYILNEIVIFAKK